jgi:O-succinylbenzoate synthase
VRIERVLVRRLSLPLIRPFETSFGRTSEKSFLLVSVTAEGATGYGEGVADDEPYYLPETNATVLHVLRDFLIPLLFTLDVDHPRALAGAFSRVRGHEMAKAALEMAVWDLYARLQYAPLRRVLGGTKDAVSAGVSIGLQPDTGALLELVAREVAAGYRRVKLKIKPGADRALVAAVRARFPQLPLMVDANSAYTLADTAVFRELDEQRLMMIEQPLAWDDLVDHAALQKEIRTAVCLDESIRSAEDARRALDIGACRIVNIKAGRVGGFAASVAVHDLCRERGVPVWCGGMLESGIGRLANVHLQTLPGFTLPGDTAASARYFEEDLVDPPVTVSREGMIAVPTGPGIGHEIVWPRVERATTWRQEWRNG